MSEQTTPDPVNEALAAMINKTLDGVDSVTLFLQAEIPDVVEQLLMWVFVKNLVIGAVLVGAGIFLWIRISAFQKGKEDSWGDDDQVFMTAIRWIGFGLLAGFGVFGSLITAIYVLVAPKVYLLEYLRHLL